MYIARVRLSALSTGCVVVCFAAALNAQTTSRQIQSGGTTVMQAVPPGVHIARGPAFGPSGDTHDVGGAKTGRVPLHRTPNQILAAGAASMEAASARQVRPDRKLAPGLNTSFDGLNSYQQQAANGFSLEPPDQGLCVGNGLVLESVNDVLRVFDSSGNPKIGVVSLNQFYGYPPDYDPMTNSYGPFITDPSCYYDQKTARWFHVALTLDINPKTGGITGKNHLDLAVTKTPDPLGEWIIYRIPVQNDGTDGTPNHNCPGGPCLGDYPHIGADKYGIYLSTNEFPFFASGFTGAQIYALPLKALEEASGPVEVAEYNTADPSIDTASGLPGFTVRPSISAGASPTALGGTEYFLSSLAVFQNNGVDNRLQLWSLTNTKSLATGGVPNLTSSIVNTEGYGVPGNARQPGTGTDGVGLAPGGGNINWPLGQCLDLTACSTFLFGAPAPFQETIVPLAGDDSRMQQVIYANENLWSSLGTGISFTGNSNSVGQAYFVLRPEPKKGTPTAYVIDQGYVANPDVDLTYGTVAVTEHGKAIMSFTATGPANYPSVGYTMLEPHAVPGEIYVSTPGLGVDDGFTGYQSFGGRPRWGDYGAAVAAGDSIWFAQEYIGQNCSLNDYLASNPIGSCNATRTVYSNWDTRISKLTP